MSLRELDSCKIIFLLFFYDQTREDKKIESYYLNQQKELKSTTIFVTTGEPLTQIVLSLRFNGSAVVVEAPGCQQNELRFCYIETFYKYLSWVVISL